MASNTKVLEKSDTIHDVTLENFGRRKAVKTIVGGVAAVSAYHLLPTTWNAPIIEMIFLPAHAATSGTSLHDPCKVTLVSGNQSTNGVVVGISGFVTPPTANLQTKIVATPIGAGSVVSIETTTAADGTFSGIATFSGGSGIMSVGVVTTVAGASGSAHCGVDIPLPNGTGNDADNDGVPDNSDICPGHDDNVDTDGNGIPDGCDGGTPNPGMYISGHSIRFLGIDGVGWGGEIGRNMYELEITINTITHAGRYYFKAVSQPFNYTDYNLPTNFILSPSVSTTFTVVMYSTDAIVSGQTVEVVVANDVAPHDTIRYEFTY